MSYLRKFSDLASYESFKNSSDWVTPNVSVVEDVTYFNRYVAPPPAVAGDVAYWNGSKVKTTPLSSWNTSLGTAIGVVVVPEGFAPDGKVRIISLRNVDYDGNQVNSCYRMDWGIRGTDTSLINYGNLPTTDNAGSTTTGSNYIGFLPSDEFTGAQSFVDSKAKYFDDTPYLPSPYLVDAPNPEYYKAISGNNALSDFNGLINTQTLVGLGADYVAANACWKYNDGVSSIQWYLPAMGELGYLMARYSEISNTMSALNGPYIVNSNYFWSSTEVNANTAYVIGYKDGYVINYSKDSDYYVRPFATI